MRSTGGCIVSGAALLCLTWSVAVAQGPQATKTYRIGFVSPISAGPTLDAFRQGLRDVGYVEGQNVVLEPRFAEGHPERLPELVAGLIKLRIDVLVVGSTAGALAAKKATTTIPIVFTGLIDPITPGLVASLARPGGNVTGVTMGIGGAGFGGKWLELLKEAAPDVSHVAAIWNSANPTAGEQVQELRTAARTLNVKVDVLDAGDRLKLDSALGAIGASGARGIVVTNDAFVVANRVQLVQFATRRRLVAIYFSGDYFVDGGGLMSYGASLPEAYRRAAGHVDKILKGTRPADLPVDQPTKFELVINLKAARTLGLTMPQTLLARADRVIE